MPLSKEDEEIFKRLARIKYRERMKDYRDTHCHKCKTELKPTDKECPNCKTKKRKYAPRTTRKNSN